MGLLPSDTFGPNYEVVSITWTASRFPLVPSLMRFGLAIARLSICLLTLAFCLSGTLTEIGCPRPGSRAAAGKGATFYPPVFSAQAEPNWAVPPGTNTNLSFPSGHGRKRVHVLQTVIESKCEVLSGKSPRITARVDVLQTDGQKRRWLYEGQTSSPVQETNKLLPLSSLQTTFTRLNYLNVRETLWMSSSFSCSVPEASQHGNKCPCLIYPHETIHVILFVSSIKRNLCSLRGFEA